MSLVSNISAAVTQIGAKIKALTARVTALESMPIHTAQTAAYTFALGDAGTCTPFNLSAAANATIPANASVAFPIGTVLYVRQAGTNAVTLVAGAGVTLNAPNGAATSAKGDWRCAVKVAADEWDVA